MTRKKMKQFVIDSLKDYDRDKLIDVIVELNITNKKLVKSNTILEHRVMNNIHEKIENMLRED